MEGKENSNVVLSVSTYTPAVAFKEARDDFLVMVSMEAPLFEDTKRAPLNLVAVVDRSGSMGGENINLVKKTLEFIVDQMRASDHLSLVSYSNKVCEHFTALAMDATGKSAARKEIKSITANGGTNLCDGLLQGMKCCSSWIKENEVSSILLLTDGLANEGITASAAIVAEMSKHKVKDSFPYTVHTFGFGGDHDALLLKQISDNARGMYFYVKNAEQIADAFGDCIGGLLSVVGQNVSLKLSPSATIKKIHTTYKTESTADYSTVIFGDIQSEEKRDVIISVALNALDTPSDSQHLLNVEMSYFNVISSTPITSKLPIVLARPQSVDPSQPVNAQIDIQRNRVNVAEALSKATKLGDQNNLNEAKKVLMRAKADILQSPSKNDPYVQSLLDNVDETSTHLKNEHEWESVGSKLGFTYAGAHGQQRANAQTEAYSTSARSKNKSALKSYSNQ